MSVDLSINYNIKKYTDTGALASLLTDITCNYDVFRLQGHTWTAEVSLDSGSSDIGYLGSLTGGQTVVVSNETGQAVFEGLSLDSSGMAVLSFRFISNPAEFDVIFQGVVPVHDVTISSYTSEVEKSLSIR